MDEIRFEEDIHLVVSRSHPNPHRYLGLHNYDHQSNIVRIFSPHKEVAPYIKVGAHIFLPKRAQQTHLFFYLLPKWVSFNEYFVCFNDSEILHDSYAFPYFWTEKDSVLFEQGACYDIYNKLGAHLSNFHGVLGTRFAVWAPKACAVSVIGDFNAWNPLCHQLRRVSSLGIWEIFIPNNLLGSLYKWSLLTESGESFIKADPYGFQFESPSSSAAKVVSFNDFIWKDEEWQRKKKSLNFYKERPLNIYEVHLGSWKKSATHEFLNYRQLAHELVRYCKDNNYTHVEILPITEHPLFESWGYQVSGFYAPTVRYGDIQDFQYFINYMHVNCLGVILDWVPGHFPLDEAFLVDFDGSSLYENREQGIHPYWKTLYFNYDSYGVINFLLGSALFWCQEMHIDGLRIDAVDSMINLDFGKVKGAWVCNHLGGKENFSAIKFLKDLNHVLHERLPGVFTIAEDSSNLCCMTNSLEQGGLGFDYKWNMGWVHDVLHFFEKSGAERSKYYSLITFGVMYSLQEQFILSLSHDECSLEKTSLWSRMPGNLFQRFANMKVLFTYFFSFPGKKTIFMANDNLQEQPWCVHKSIKDSRSSTKEFQEFELFRRALNHLYLHEENLWKDDNSFQGFSWITCQENDKGVFVFKRSYEISDSYLVCIHNFSSFCWYNFPLHLEGSILDCQEIFNSENLLFGGSGQKSCYKLSKDTNGYILTVDIFKFSSIIFKIYNKVN